MVERARALNYGGIGAIQSEIERLLEERLASLGISVARQVELAGDRRHHSHS